MSKRFNLRDYQLSLLQRLKLRAATGLRVATMGVVIGNDHYLVDMSEVGEVLKLPKLTEVPFTKSWYRGIANVRGNIYSITDLAAFMGKSETRQDAQCRILLVGQKFAFNAGFLVSRVLGVRDPLNWKMTQQDGVANYQDENGQQWTKLDIANLINNPDFLHIGA